MAGAETIASQHVTLADAVDHLLNRGAVLIGDATLSVAGVDLVYLGLNLVVSSVETMAERGEWRPHPAAGSRQSEVDPRDLTPGPSPTRRGEDEVGARSIAPAPVEDTGARASPSPRPSPAREREVPTPTAGPTASEGPDRGLARLVLALIELLRQIMERQALRRMEGQGLSEEQIERMGRGLMELAAKMAELRAIFGLREDDLAIDLGPLGKLY